MTAATGFPVGALTLAVALILVNGLFVAAEFALLASRRTRVEPFVESGRLGARSALSAMGDIGLTLAGTQLGITIASLALGSVAEPAVGGIMERIFGLVSMPERVNHVLSLVVALSLVVFSHLLVGEMIPKSYALAEPERTLVTLAGPVRAFTLVLRPVIWMLNQMARLGARALGVTPADELRTAHTAAEIGVMVEESREEGLLEADEVTLLAGALAFVGRTVAGVMVPLDRVVTVGSGDTVARAEEVVRQSGHSRVLVRGDRPGVVVGFVHAKGLLALDPAERPRPLPPALMRSTFEVTADQELVEVLVRMRNERRHLALVVGPQGTVIGVVTLEDVLESIVGDIVDETDRPARP